MSYFQSTGGSFLDTQAIIYSIDNRQSQQYIVGEIINGKTSWKIPNSYCIYYSLI